MSRPLLTVDPLGDEMFEYGIALIIAGTETMLLHRTALNVQASADTDQKNGKVMIDALADYLPTNDRCRGADFYRKDSAWLSPASPGTTVYPNRSSSS
jgi:hypothetical protein